MADLLQPNDVFRPGKLPIEQNNVYAPRGAKEIDFRTFISRGWVPIVYGEYGVGKTSLARHVLKEYSDAGKLVNVESVDGKEFEEIVQQILEKIGFSILKKETSSQSVTRTSEVSGKIPIR